MQPSVLQCCGGRIASIAVSLLLFSRCGLLGAHPLADSNSLDDTAMAESDGGGGSWISSATSALAPAMGPAMGQFAMYFAKEMISRSAGNSQVSEPEPARVVPALAPISPKTFTDILSLNLSNLLVLVLLKALIFAAGLVGAGNWGHYTARSRSDDDNFLIGRDEPPLLLGFLIAEGIGDDSCLRHAACTKPVVAHEYMRAAKALLQGAQLTGTPSAGSLEHYRTLIERIDLAVLDGQKGGSGQCHVKYRCNVLV